MSEQVTPQPIAALSHFIVVGGKLVCFFLAVSAMFSRFLELENHVHSPRLVVVWLVVGWCRNYSNTPPIGAVVCEHVLTSHLPF